MEENSTHQVVKSFTLQKISEKCLSRQCEDYKNKELTYHLENIVTKYTITYYKWVSKKEQRQSEKTKKTIVVQLTKKEMYSGKISEILILFKSELELILKHEFNILHQYNVSENLKNN